MIFFNSDFAFSDGGEAEVDRSRVGEKIRLLR